MSDNPTKTITEIKSLARAHTESAVKVLAGIMNQPKAPAAARVSAANSLIERGWGKPTQPHGGDEDAPAIKHVHEIVRRIVKPGDTDSSGV